MVEPAATVGITASLSSVEVALAPTPAAHIACAPESWSGVADDLEQLIPELFG
jgi:hypothetical protein